MEALTVSDYRKNLSSAFDKASRGETVLIRRRNQIFTLTNVGSEDLEITPNYRKRLTLQEKNIEKVKHYISRLLQKYINGWIHYELSY